MKFTVGGDITMMSMETRLNRLKTAKLKEPRLECFSPLLVDINDNSVWKRRKKDHIVNHFFASVYELWNGRLIERVFYVCQKWEFKEKKQFIYEVQRYLAGSKYKLNRGIYNASFSSIRLIYWKLFEDCDWFLSENERYTISSCNYIAGYIPQYYMNSYQPLLKKSIHKYCGFEYSGWMEEKLFWYLYQYEKHPQLELIAKMDMLWILEGNLNAMCWSKKGWRVFGLQSKDEIESVKLCRYKGGLKYYKRHREAFKKFQIDTREKLEVYDVLQARNYQEISLKLIRYLAENDVRPTDYLDYIGFCQTLGIPLTSAVKYPENFKTAHDQLQNQITINACRQKTKAIQKQVNDMLFKYRYADENLIITPANSVEDLIDESKQLNHCVRTYADRYAKGETSIFLIRRQEDVLTPFYTLELKNHKINQVRGIHNCDPTKEVKDFVTRWARRNHLNATIYQNY